jgi:hypothetical protein
MIIDIKYNDILKKEVNILNKNNYYKLLETIKKTKINENYKPKQYKFGLKDFDKNGNIKKRENQRPSHISEC